MRSFTEDATIHVTSGGSVGGLDKRIQLLADRLKNIHGDVVVAKEAKGTHIYMACPECLVNEGRKELSGRHLALNADRFLGLGDFAARAGTYNNDSCASCMKTGRPFQANALLAMPPLEQRGIQMDREARLVISSVARYLVPDENGNMVPPPPGLVVPVYTLPQSHPAALYLQERRFDRHALWDHMQVSWCLREFAEVRRPDHEGPSFIYKRLPAGWKDTPQGRLIFYGHMRGVRRVWQARYITRELPGKALQAWHPYNNRWETTHVPVMVDPVTGKTEWGLVPPYDELDQESLKPRWAPAKYWTVRGSLRNECLMGYDSSAAAALLMPSGRRWCIVTEGPLDAARFGPPAVAAMGKAVSEVQARLLGVIFDHVILAFDRDSAGSQAVKSALNSLRSTRMGHSMLTPPKPLKDWGETPEILAKALLQHHLKTQKLI